MTPERLSPDPSVAAAAFRYRSRSVPGRTYDVAFAPDGTASCECWPFLNKDACKHIVHAQELLAIERAPTPSRACTHRLTFTELAWGDLQGQHRARTCLFCGLAYDRDAALARLQEAIRERYRLPSSPYTAEERSRDPS